MKSSDPVEIDSVFAEQAAEWLFEREEGFAPGRAEAFLEWCNEDPRHAQAVARVEETLFLLERMPSATGRLAKKLSRARSRSSRVTHFQSVLWTAGIAAALVFGLVAWWSPGDLSVPRHSIAQGNVYSSNSSAPRRVALSDGSVVDLNANSNLEVRFSGTARNVELTTGEAHFQVAHDASRPFVVTVNGVAIRAVGTAFNVRLIGQSVDVLVTEGKIEFIRASQVPSKSEAILPVLVAGERTQVSPAPDQLSRVEVCGPDTIQSILSWQERMTSFVDVPLREMIARMNRCNSTRLILADPSLEERAIGGVVSLRNVDAFVLMLEQDGDIVAERRSETEIVLRRTR